eukprot:UC1_evm1s255
MAFTGMPLAYGYDTTKEGFEIHIGVNHVVHHYLTSLLLDTLKASAPSRVVAVSSTAERGSYPQGFEYSDWVSRPKDYEDGRAYAQSKLANILDTRALAEKLKGTGVTAYSCHPGIIETELGRHLEPEMYKRTDKMPPVQRYLQENVLIPVIQGIMFSAPKGALTQLHLSTAPAETLTNGGYYTPVGQHKSTIHPQGQNMTRARELWDVTEAVIDTKRPKKNLARQEAQ